MQKAVHVPADSIPRYMCRPEGILFPILRNYVGSEHLLLALGREGGPAARVLADAGAPQDRVRAELLAILAS